MSVPLFTLTVYPDKAYIDPKRYFFFSKELRDRKLAELNSEVTFNLSTVITEDDPPVKLPPCAPEVIGDGS